MEKIKSTITNSIESEKGKTVLIVIIVILVALGSFELGRLSKSTTGGGVKVEYPDKEQGNQVRDIIQANALSATDSAKSISTNTQKSNSSVSTSAKNFFASSRGKKYYPVGCSAGKSLKQENRIYFATREEAQKAGYELSSSCR